MNLLVYDRRARVVYDEPQYGVKRLHFLYESKLGRLLLFVIFARPWYSTVCSIYNRTPFSARKIPSFIDHYRIDLSECPHQAYNSFDSFITRKINPKVRPIAPLPALIALADSKLMVYEVSKAGRIPIKQTTYNVAQLLNDPKLAALFYGGTCLVFRLSMDDCHHYCFVDDGKVVKSSSYKGVLHSIRPIAGQQKPLIKNSRRVSVLKTTNFGMVAQVEIGALLVGTIHDLGITQCHRGQGKGYFSLGGSTIVLLLTRDQAEIDDDILRYSRKGIETKVHLGEQIGRKHV
jgi:phosphatidylserine decarboxylase